MNEFIFRKYDIRGVVETDFSDEVVQNLGRAFGTYVIRSGGVKIAVSGDIRPSTPKLIRNLVDGLISTGIDVIDLGILPTPVNYYSMFELPIDGAVQITGSHNPPEFNGFKISLNQNAFHSEQIQDLKKLIDDKSFEVGKGKVLKEDILPSYLNMLKSKIKIRKQLKVVIDCGNASGCITAPTIFNSLGIKVKTGVEAEVKAGADPKDEPEVNSEVEGWRMWRRKRKEEEKKDAWE